MTDQYEAWQDYARDQLRDQGYTEDEITQSEICEDGTVHFHRGSIYDWERCVISLARFKEMGQLDPEIFALHNDLTHNRDGA